MVKVLHWLEATSNSPDVETHGLGLLAETLLDNLLQVGDTSKQKISNARRTTRQRKKEIASEQRAKALAKLNIGNTSNADIGAIKAAKAASKKDVKRSVAGSLPDWMAEANNMKEETGVTCAVCQEGRSLQPQELLGLYAFVKKVSLMNDKCGSKDAISGTSMLKRLPPILPPSLHGSVHVEDWFSTAKVTSSEMATTAVSSRRTTAYTTSVSAGTGIHFSCHRRARAVDRSHPKAPKSEWNGASLRNNRVSCNIILPLVSPLSSKLLPIGRLESVLGEYQSFVASALESPPQSMLWSTLYDVYLLLLRIAYNEDLSADCGGGSLASNCELMYYQFIAADTFDRDAQAENITYSAHARCLAGGLLSAVALINEDGASYNSLSPYVGDAAPMAAICSVVFHNCAESSSGSQLQPFPKRQWILGRDFFLRSLIISAGRRCIKHMRGSGCAPAESVRRVIIQDEQVGLDRPVGGSSDRLSLDIAPFLLPMLVLFAVVDHISMDFSPAMSDEQIRDSTQRLVALLADCRRIRSVPEMMRRLNVTCRDEEVAAYFEKGMVRIGSV
jgi:E3 ubiquitin-protein ligase UBR4